MRNKILLLVASGILATPAWTAEKEKGSKHENIGLGSGAAIGAAAGGPVGLIVGAAFGAWLGDRFHNERSERLALERKYNEAQASATSLEGELAGSKRQMTRMESELLAQRIAHREDLQRALDISIMFRTGESTLSEDAEQRLAQLAKLIGPIEGTEVRLEGHADMRGDEEYNDKLSAERAEAVRDALIRGGMPEDRITLTAMGESESYAGEKDLDAMAFDRRVQVKLIDRRSESHRVARQ